MSPNPNSLLAYDSHNHGTVNKGVKKMLFTPDKKNMSIGGMDQFDDSVLGDPLTEAIKNIELRHSLE
jgi:hypothetical protein